MIRIYKKKEHTSRMAAKSGVWSENDFYKNILKKMMHHNGFKIILCSTAVLSLLNWTEAKATNMADESLAVKASSQTIAVNSDNRFEIDDQTVHRAATTEQIEQEASASTATSSMNARTLFLRASFLLR